MKQRYRLGDQRLTRHELYDLLPKSKSSDFLGLMTVQTACGLQVKLVLSTIENR